jgi:hypothetical protein
MRRRAASCAAAASAAAAVLLLLPGPVAGHAIGGTFQLPVPLNLYLAGAAAAVAASFVVTALIARRAVEPSYRTLSVGTGVATAFRLLLRTIGLVWWYGAIVVGFVVGDITPLPAVLFWIGIWVGFPIVAVLLGNPWPSFSPFRTTYTELEWLARRIGFARLDAGIGYPSRLARWPAVALLSAGIWAELVLPGGSTAGTVAWFLLGYTILTLAGMTLFGQVAWLRHAELFEVLLGWFGRIGPVGRRVAVATVCDGCHEACDPARCIDCPECSVAADDHERRVELRPWIVGLTEVDRAGWSDAAFIVLALAGVSFDGMGETAFGARLLNLVQPPVIEILGPTANAFLLADTIIFVMVAAAFFTAFLAVVWVTHALGDPDTRRPLAHTAGAYAATLLPIAAGYVIAHYLTLVIQGAVWLPSLILDPLMSLAPVLDWIPTEMVWYVSVVAIVGGHIAGIVLAHRNALRDAPSRPVVAGIPMVALMIGYTVLSLWIIAQPIVVDPGTTPPSASASLDPI